jgi:hypothetical protein
MKPPSHAFVSKEDVMQESTRVSFGLALPGIDENTNLGSRFREPRFDRKQREFRAWADTVRNLKTNVRAEGHAQVVVRAVGKADFITDVSAQADGTDMSLYPATRIEHGTDTVSTQSSRTVKESA